MALTSTIVTHNFVINIIFTINVPIAIYLFKKHNFEFPNKKFHKNLTRDLIFFYTDNRIRLN